MIEVDTSGHHVAVQWAADVVVVPIDRAAVARDVIDEVLITDDGHSGNPVEPVRRATVAGALRQAVIKERTIAARWQRLAGWFIDSLFVGIAGRSLAELGLNWWLIGGLAGLYWVSVTAIWGATIGKAVAGTTVRFRAGRSRWWSSFARWAVTGVARLRRRPLSGDQRRWLASSR